MTTRSNYTANIAANLAPNSEMSATRNLLVSSWKRKALVAGREAKPSQDPMMGQRINSAVKIQVL